MRSFSASSTRPWPDEPARSPHPRAALSPLSYRVGAVLGLLSELQPEARVARHAAGDERGGRLLRVDGLGCVVVLSLVRSQHPGQSLERGTAEGAEGIQIPRPLRLGLRRRRDVSNAVLPVVRALADV